MSETTQQKRRQSIQRPSIEVIPPTQAKRRASITIKPASNTKDSSPISVFNFFRSIAKLLLI